MTAARSVARSVVGSVPRDLLRGIGGAPSVEHVTNGTMDASGGWTLNADWTITGGQLTHSAGTAIAENALLTPLVAGSVCYWTVVFFSPTTTASLQLRVFDGVTTQIPATFAIGTSGTQTGSFVASANHTVARFVPFGGATGCVIESLSIVGP